MIHVELLADSNVNFELDLGAKGSSSNGRKDQCMLYISVEISSGNK